MSPWTLVIRWVVYVTFYSALGLTVAAAVHRQWAGLQWEAVGTLSGALFVAGLALHVKWLQWRLAISVPGEEPALTLDRLRERTARSLARLDRPVPGEEGWLTAAGWQSGCGCLLRWSEFQSWSLVRSQTGDFLLSLTRAQFPVEYRLRAYLYILGAAIGPIVTSLGVYRLLPVAGLRYDVLALAVLAVCYTAWCSGFVGKLLSRQGFHPTTRTVWIPARVTGKQDLENLLRRHLPLH